jgi:serine/threonine protein kinase
MEPQPALKYRWQQLESLFYAALEMEPDLRAGFLDKACQGDLELHRDVASLLESADKTLTSLRKPVDEAAAAIASGSPSVGRRIGPYQLISLLGKGGMGDVYLAQRADDQYRQQVAIKLMQGWSGSRSAMLLRFRAERQILANLDHPNIGRLMDGGMTDEGAPYLVMEYVDGKPIDEYCRIHELSIRQRLGLFRSVCAAVDYAHHNLVIHRDIKPANILVTSDGVPKLLDFGIAKLLDARLAEREEAGQEHPLTRATERWMTPEYASPEQVRGLAVTTATDVFGLGVLLYELLTGQRPFRSNAGNSLDIERAVCEVDPKPPSEVRLADGDRERPAADLDKIVLMAMRKEPERRYTSAAQLAADVQSYLDGYPLVARPDTWGYRADRFIRRHKGVVAAAALFALTLVGFSIGMALLARRANREQTIARQESDFMAGMFKAATPESSRGRTVTARDLLDLGAKRINNDQALDPEVRASLLENIAQDYRNIGLYDEAISLAQSAYTLKSKLYGANDSQVATSTDLLASLYRDKAEYDQAEPLFRKPLAIRRRSPGQDKGLLAIALANLGECLYQEEKDPEAEALMREALAIDRVRQTEIGGALRNYLALLLERKGEYPEAGVLLREAVDLDRRLEGADSPNYAVTLHNFSGALIDSGDLTAAEEKLRETLALRRRILGNTHPQLIYTLNNLAYVLIEKGTGSGGRAVCEGSFGDRPESSGGQASFDRRGGEQRSAGAAGEGRLCGCGEAIPSEHGDDMDRRPAEFASRADSG